MANYKLFSADQAKRIGKTVRAYEAGQQGPPRRDRLLPVPQGVPVWAYGYAAVSMAPQSLSGGADSLIYLGWSQSAAALIDITSVAPGVKIQVEGDYLLLADVSLELDNGQTAGYAHLINQFGMGIFVNAVPPGGIDGYPCHSHWHDTALSTGPGNPWKITIVANDLGWGIPPSNKDYALPSIQGEPGHAGYAIPLHLAVDDVVKLYASPEAYPAMLKSARMAVIRL